MSAGIPPTGPRTLDARWQHVNQALDAKFPADARFTMQQLFYAGASSVLAILMERGHDEDIPTRVARLLHECADFVKPKVVLSTLVTLMLLGGLMGCAKSDPLDTRVGASPITEPVTDTTGASANTQQPGRRLVVKSSTAAACDTLFEIGNNTRRSDPQEIRRLVVACFEGWVQEIQR